VDATEPAIRAGESRPWRLLRRSLPALVSVALLAWLLWRIRFSGLAAAAADVDWGQILPATAVLVLALYFWEALCFRELFHVDNQPVSYREMLRVRGLSYLAAVVNYEAGQAMAAWHAAQLQRRSLLWALSRTILLAYHDLVVLLALAVLGSAWSSDPQVVELRPFFQAGLIGLISLGGAAVLLLGRGKGQLRASRWGAWLESWTWLRSARLAGVRIVYFSIFIVYAAVALRLGGVPLDGPTTVGTIPLVLLADALPSASGLGTRDAALQFLVATDRREVLLAISLTWSLGLLTGRLAIGLAYLWWPRRELTG
jgi:hypothetical protein